MMHKQNIFYKNATSMQNIVITENNNINSGDVKKPNVAPQC